MKYDLSKFSAAQLSYLQGLVEKCAELKIDPRPIIKMSAGFWDEVGGGLKDVGNEITQGISELPSMQWLASNPETGYPGQFNPLDQYNEQLKQTRMLAQKSMDPTLSKAMPENERAMGQYYNKMYTDPKVLAAANINVEPKGWSRIGRAFGRYLPGAAERQSRYGAEESMAKARSQAGAIGQFVAKNPYKPPASKEMAEEIKMPYVDRTSFVDPMRSNFGPSPTPYNYA